MFSKSCQYALQAILCIAFYGGTDKRLTLKEISSSQGIPIHFLGKIMQILSKNGIVKSVPGPNGGFFMATPPKSLRLIKIVELIDGNDIFNQCGIGFKKCSDQRPCPIHLEYKSLKTKLKDLLTNKSVAELCDDVKDGNSVVSFNLKKS